MILVRTMARGSAPRIDRGRAHNEAVEASVLRPVEVEDMAP